MPRGPGVLAWLAILIVFAISILSLVGGIFGITLFTNIKSQWIPIRAVTAICLALSALELVFLQWRPLSLRGSFARQAPGILVGLVGLLTIVLYAIRMITGQEPSLGDVPFLNLFLNSHGRMALLTAILFLITGGALVLLATGRRRAAHIAHALMIPVAMLSYMVPVSYLLGVQYLHGWYDVPVALYTGVAFCALSVAILCVRPDTWLMRIFTGGDAGGVMARRLLPGLLMIPLLIGWLRLYGERIGAFQADAGAVLVVVTYTFCLLWLIWMTARSLNKTDDRRREVDEALRKERDFVSAVLDTEGALVVVLDRQGHITRFNRACEETTGYPAAEVRGRVFWEFLVPSEELPGVSETWNALKAGDFPNSHENHWLARDGSRRFIAWSNTALIGEAGEVDYVIATGLDITHRKAAQEALLRAKEAWERTFAGVPDLIAILDNQHRIERVNEAMARRLGVKAEEVVGLDCYEVVHGLSEPPDYCPHSRTVKDGLQHTEEVHDDHLGGDFMISTTPLYDDQGQMIGAVHLAHDITERKRAEDRLRESEKRMSRAEEIANLGGWELDVVHNHLSWSDQVFRIFGLQPREFAASYDAFLDAVHPDDRAAVDDAYSGSLREGRDRYEIEHRIIRKADGEVRIVHEKCEHIRDGAGTIIRSAGMVHDITERKKAEEALQEAHSELEKRVQERTAELSRAYEKLETEMTERAKAEDQLRQSQKMEAVGTLAGGIAHDFNNILAAILGFTEMALDDVADRPEVERNLENVLKSAMRARDLVKQILAFSRKTSYERTPLSLTPLVKETVRLLRASIPATIEITLANAARSDTILASPVEIQQILMNLAANASLAMQEKGGALEIGLTDIDLAPDSSAAETDMPPGEYLQLTVKDTGTGMSPHVMKRVFEPFFTTREVGKGTGMGLAVVYGIVKDLRGAITVESTPGKGATFRVLLPKIPAEVKKEHLSAPRAAGGRERILFVDDEKMLAEWGQAMLERLGYTVTAMTDSAEALRIFSSDPFRFDLIITDQAMPGMAGVQLVKLLLRIRSDLPIILCTGHSETVSPDIAREAGIREFLMKPLARQELAQAVRRVLDKKGGYMYSKVSPLSSDKV
jgi:PAS domain S-box-containing protein